MKVKNNIIKFLILFNIFGAIYYTIETIYKYPRPSHWSMFLVGGLLCYSIGLINNNLDWSMPFWKQCLVGGIWITFLEGLSGVILNIGLGLNIWHYEKYTFFFGQCCWPFAALWVVLAGVAIVLDDFLRWWLFGEEWPHYVWK